MRLATFSQPVHLQQRQIVSLKARKGQPIDCQSGHLWITQDGDLRDVVIGANESFTLDRTGKVLVYALDEASFVMRQAGETARLMPAARPALRGNWVATSAC